VKKKSFVTPKDKEDWLSYIKNPKDIYNKEKNNKKKENLFSKILDLHGLSLDEANKVTKNFITKCSEKGYRKLIIITGKGLRSKKYEDPYVSDKTSILKNSIPDYIYNDPDLSTIVDKISKAEQKDGGDGAIYVFLKKTIK
tara:strand:- start:114 stop:536 length:423 start_codon:yes stop_codon:yes gene_type:complete